MVECRTRVTFVYGEAQVQDRYKTWDMLRGIAGNNNLPWAVIGDFNEVLHAHEHDGVGQHNQAQMDAFRVVMDTCGLMDIGSKGSCWTFEKKVAGGTYTRVRLDMCLANPAWCMAFPTPVLEHKTAASSDHAPILLKFSDVQACKKPPRAFKYELMWERDPDLFEFVGTGWKEKEGGTVADVRDKLSKMSRNLTTWDRTHFGSVRLEIAHLKAELDRLRSSRAGQGPNHAEIKITDRLVELYHREEILWRQRARNKAKKNQHCALKLDMTKAYDKVEWAYLKDIMLKLGVKEKWVEIVMGMVSSVKFSVLFNGKKLEQFKPSCGIRQGDPISPYMFLIAAEGLSCLLKSKSKSSNLHGLQVAPSAPPVSHLLFVDDSLLFFKANGMGANEVNQVLDAYCQATGINYDKSSIFFCKGVPEAARDEINVGNLP
ncbi:uncharacterized protein [Aegilops tauschii subsp. strangulata]|uniref:uncharacterized protein n=1 Tax=Aegilops tauschii subsp. strangulata TaxID=200361 RepID=UPI003CC87F01